MQFAIIARDGTDEGALERRMSIRPRHLENMAKVRETGSVICAGGLTDENGRLAGSFLIMDFETRDLLDDYLANEPYMTGGVWKDISIDTCNVVIQNDVLYKK